MANPLSEKISSREGRVKETLSTLQDVSERFRDRTKDVVGDASDWVNDAYSKANDWFQDNRLIGTLGIIAAAGLIGFFIGRSSKSSGVFEGRSSLSEFPKASEM